MTPWVVRDYEDGDGAAVTALRGDAGPERGGPRSRLRVVAERGGEFGGVGIAWETFAPRKYRLELIPPPGCGDFGFAALVEALIARVRAAGGVSIQARAEETEVEALAFWQERGFAEVHRMVRLYLPLTEADPAAMAALAARMPEGITICTLAEEQRRRPDWLDALLEAHNASLAGWADPDPDPIPQQRPCTRERLAGDLRALPPLPDGFFIARRGETYLGYSGLAADPEGGPELISSGTAVRAEERARGIATALKARGALFARERGYPAIVTSTASPSMLAVNLKLGFRRRSAEVRLVRRLT